jgi:hypothetical protein
MIVTVFQSISRALILKSFQIYLFLIKYGKNVKINYFIKIALIFLNDCD